ncbi:PAS domain S-box protein [Schlesneria sp. T3-172]|uniref:PAS domain S-box protein n=1 Tax=Schlesneria sphaerica TaxID=3373610 RepID=UPI0037C91A98
MAESMGRAYTDAASGDSGRILLVDDNPSNLLAIRSLLEDLAQDIVEVRSGDEAIQRAATEEFAVILLDVKMPGLSGFETAAAIRSGERSHHTPIILITAGDLERSQLQEGYALGAVDFLSKPIMPVALQAKVKSFVHLFQEKQRARHESDQFRLLVQGTTDYAIFMLDPQGRVATWNAGAERIKGYRADEIIGQHFTKFYPQEAIDRGWPEYELKVATAEGRFEDEGWRLRKDGSQFWAVVVITALRDVNGNLRGFSKVTRDLTARKRVEESLRQTEERFRLLIETATDYAIFVLDPQGHVVSWNAGAERIKQYTAHEIIGQHFSKFYPQEAIHQGRPDNALRRAREEGRYEDEDWRVRRDGSRFWANVVIAALKDEHGHLRGFSKITRDMTSRKEAEENTRKLIEEAAARKAAEENARLIRDQREWLRVTLASIGDAVIATDTSGRVTLLNPVAEGLTGWTIAEAQGRPLDEVFVICNEQTRRTVENPVEKVLRDGAVVGLANHTILIAKNGDEHPIDDSAAPIRNEAGNMIGVVLVFRDVTEHRRAERELKASEARKSAILETALDGIVTMDHQGKVVDFNSAAEKAFGYSRSEIVGQPMADFLVPVALRQQFYEGLERYLQTGIGAHVGQRHELSALNADGTETPFEVSITRSTSEGLPLFTAYLRDIRDRKRSEAVLRGQKRVLELLVQGAPLPDVLDALCEVMEGNAEDNLVAMVQLASSDGKRLRATAGRRVPADYFRAMDGIVIGPDAGACGLAAFRGEATLVADLANENVTVENRELALAHGLTAGWITPIHSSEGKVLGTFAVYFPNRRQPTEGERQLVDVLTSTASVAIERRRAEAAVRESEKTARFLAEASASLAVLEDFDSTLQKVASLAVPHFADWATVDLVEADGVLRRVAVAHVDPVRVALAHEVHRRFSGDQISTRGAWNVIRTGRAEVVPEISEELLRQSVKDDEAFHVLRELGLKSYLGVPLKVRGRIIGVVTFIGAESGKRYTEVDLVTAQDLADRASIAIENTRMYRELIDADRRKDEFLATLAHELRNPLAPIRNSLQILKMPQVDEATARQSREMMERQVHHLVRLVDDLLDLSRVMRGKIELRKEAVELASIVARAVETARPLIDSQGHRLEISLPEESLVIDGDPVRLTQVVGNLLTNSAKYTDAGGHIHLTIRREGDLAVLSVKDTGIGIAPEMLPRVFELFVQADHATTKAQGGLGIGLTLVKNLVEMHGGSVSVTSEGLGQGSEFTVRLLLMNRQQQNGDDSNHTADGAEVPHARHRVLVVDDNQDAALSLTMLLRLHGHEVQVAHDGLSALKLAETFHPAVIFLDIGMPGMDGYEVARRIRKNPEMKGTVLTALTGWGQLEDRRRTAEAGFDYHLVKPPEPQAVENILASLPKSISP